MSDLTHGRAQLEAVTRILIVIGYAEPYSYNFDSVTAEVGRLVDTLRYVPAGAKRIVTVHASTWAMETKRRSTHVYFDSFTPLEQLEYLEARRARLIAVVRQYYKVITHTPLKRAVRAAVRAYFLVQAALRREATARLFEDL